MEHAGKNVVHIFWTSGWDSTFRLIQLLLQGKKVQTYYIIDENRLSTSNELYTMKQIKKGLLEKYPKTKGLMMPTIFKAVFDIQQNQELTKRYHKICERSVLGTQYEWLARFCSETGVEGIELCIEKDQNTGAFKVLNPFLVISDSEEKQNYIFNKEYIPTDEYELFRFYSFPLFGLSKIETLNIARNEGFEEFLDMTWFCHTPRKNNQPCGVCAPCTHLIERGLGRRIPLSSRIRYYSRNRSRAIQLLAKNL